MVEAISVTVNREGEQALNRGEWWFPRGQVREDKEIPEGHVVDLLDTEGNYRARGLYSSRGPVAVRRISQAKVDVDLDFFVERIRRALDRRGSIAQRNSFRVVHGQGDVLPGLIIEVYDSEWVVVQLRNQAMERFSDTVVEAIREVLNPTGILARNDSSSRETEGLKQEVKMMFGKSVPGRVKVRTEPFEVVTDLWEGQKTGAYLDQVPNRRRFRRVGMEGTVLDLFCYVGEWGLSAIEGGADRVIFVDQDREALDLVEENLDRNGWEERGKIVRADGFDYLHENGDSFDHAVIDPPAFARGADQLDGATKGYRDLNFRVMRQMKQGGLLATSSCSSPIGSRKFFEILDQAREDADVNFRILEEGGQGPDHPWLSNFPVGRYLNSILGWVSLE